MNYKSSLHRIKAFAFDVDGVFTNSLVLAIPGGDFLRMHNTKDGYAISYAAKQGYPIAIITGGDSETIRARFKLFGITDVYLASSDKLNDFRDFCFKYHLQPDEVLFMGDDIPDIEVLEKCGLAACPADAVHEVKEICAYISDKNGGMGCVRDVIEQTLRLQNEWNLRGGAFSA